MKREPQKVARTLFISIVICHPALAMGKLKANSRLKLGGVAGCFRLKVFFLAFPDLGQKLLFSIGKHVHEMELSCICVWVLAKSLSALAVPLEVSLNAAKSLWSCLCAGLQNSISFGLSTGTSISTRSILSAMRNAAEMLLRSRKQSFQTL